MVNASIATFVIGAEAADSVQRQLETSRTYLNSTAAQATGNNLNEIAASFDQLLSDFPDGFDTSCHPRASEALRVIWQPHEKTAGILYVVKSSKLQTINLVLSGVNPKADVKAIEEVGRTLSPIDAYFEPLAVVRFGSRPIVATFCGRTGGLDPGVDLVQLAFAGVFFQRCGLRSPDPKKRQPLTRPNQNRVPKSNIVNPRTSRLS